MVIIRLVTCFSIEKGPLWEHYIFINIILVSGQGPGKHWEFYGKAEWMKCLDLETEEIKFINSLVMETVEFIKFFFLYICKIFYYLSVFKIYNSLIIEQEIRNFPS